MPGPAFAALALSEASATVAFQGRLCRVVAAAADATAALVVGEEAVRLVVSEQAAHVADVVKQQGDDRVQPLVGANVTLGNQPTPENGLADVGDQDRVLEIVIRAVTAQQRFQRGPRGLIEDVLVA